MFIENKAVSPHRPYEFAIDPLPGTEPHHLKGGYTPCLFQPDQQVVFGHPHCFLVKMAPRTNQLMLTMVFFSSFF